MRRSVAMLATVASLVLLAPGSAGAASPREGHISIADGPFELCGLPNVSYQEETDYRLVSRHPGPDGDWTFTMLTTGFYSFTNDDTERVVTATYRKADRDLKVLSSDGDSRTLQVMNNRIEFWTNDLGQRLDSVAGPISYTVTVSYAGTPSDPADDYWLSDLSDIRVRGDWSLDDTFCHVMVANLT
jgi:hypothetical protein